MKQRIKRLQILLFILMALAGIALGMGAALLVLNFTTDAKGVSFAGLICLIIVAALCLALPLIAHYRASLIASLLLCNTLFGQEVHFLDEDALFKKYKKEIVPVYVLRVKLDHGDDLDVKKVYFSLSNALEEYVSAIATVAYTRAGDFLFVTDNEAVFLKGMKSVEKKMLEDPNISPFVLLLGYSDVGEDMQTRLKEAFEASLIDSSIRESLSIVAYKREEKDQTANFNIDNEEAMKRLHYDIDEYVHEEERVGLLRPWLYDAMRGDIQGKDLFHRCELYRVRGKLDFHAFQAGVERLEKSQDLRILFRIGKESIENPSFLSQITAELQEKQIPTSSFVLMINALNIEEIDVKHFIAHAKGLGYGFGVYEYGGEDLLLMAKLEPEIISIKSENTRIGANRKQLDALFGASEAIPSKLFVEKELLGEERSYYRIEKQNEDNKEAEA